MNTIKIGKHIVEIDSNRTRMGYRNIDFESYRCNCDGCRNYYAYADKFEDEIKSFFKQLGIDDMKNCTEVWMCCKDEEQNIATYNGWFHVYGQIIEGIDVWRNDLPWDERIEKITENFSVGFSNSLSLVEKEFEDGCIQIEFFTDIKWVIEDEV